MANNQQDSNLSERVFAGIYPCGVVYADRFTEIGGDYARLAFLPYDTLELQFEPRCTRELRAFITANAQLIQARKGEHYQISTSGQTVLLGSRAPSAPN